MSFTPLNNGIITRKIILYGKLIKIKVQDIIKKIFWKHNIIFTGFVAAKLLVLLELYMELFLYTEKNTQFDYVCTIKYHLKTRF